MALHGPFSEDSNDEEVIVKEEVINDAVTPTRLGTSINPEIVETVVEIALEIGPEIASQAQAKLDEEQRANIDAQEQAQLAKIAQDEKKPEHEKKSDELLQEAEDKLRNDETKAEHDARLAAEPAKVEAAKLAAKEHADELAHEAQVKIEPKLDAIHAHAQAVLDDRDEEIQEAALAAQQHKEEEEKRKADNEEKAQAARIKKQEQDKMFTQGDGKIHAHTANAQVEKLAAMLKAGEKSESDEDKKLSVVEIAAKIEAGHATNTKEEKKSDIEPSKTNVATLLTAFEKKKVEDKEEKKSVHRSGNIAAIAKTFEGGRRLQTTRRHPVNEDTAKEATSANKSKAKKR